MGGTKGQGVWAKGQGKRGAATEGLVGGVCLLGGWKRGRESVVIGGDGDGNQGKK